MKLSTNFELHEFLKTNYPDIKLKANDTQRKNLKRLCQNVLEKIREITHTPIIITSGIRSARLNKRVGGAINSFHLYGLASDFYIKNAPTPLIYVPDILKTISHIKLIYYPTEIRFHIELLNTYENKFFISINKKYYDFSCFFNKIVRLDLNKIYE